MILLMLPTALCMAYVVWYVVRLARGPVVEVDGDDMPSGGQGAPDVVEPEAPTGGVFAPEVDDELAAILADGARLPVYT